MNSSDNPNISNWMDQLPSNLSDIPVENIDGPDLRFKGHREGRYLGIRCRAHIDVFCRVSFKDSGRCRIRLGEGNIFQNLGEIEGPRHESVLQVAVFLPADDSKIVTILTEGANNLLLETKKEFDAVLIGNAKYRVTAWPLLKESVKCSLRGAARISQSGTPIVKLNTSTYSSTYKSTGSKYVYVPGPTEHDYLDIELPPNPFIEVIGTNEGHDQVETGVSVFPKAF